jgi:hypothetical protein
MKSFLFSLCVMLALCPATLFAQNAKATEYMNAGKYSDAVTILEAARTRNEAPLPDLVNLAYCYLMLHDYSHAEEVYATVVQDKKADAKQYFLYAEVLKINGKYDDAILWYQKYAALNPSEFICKQRLQSCDSLKLWKSIPVVNKVANVAEVNTVWDELWPGTSGTDLIYISNNRQLLANSGTKTQFEDPQISFIYQKSRGNTAIIRPFSDSVTYTCYSSAYGKQAVVVKTVKKSPDGDKFGPSVILISDNGRQWREFRPEGMPEGYITTHPCIARNGSRIYFASNIPGGYGESDLYYSDNVLGVWTKPVNLGSTINTPGDEMFPYIANHEQSLYFASDGHPGYGNLDLFRSEYTSAGWGTPSNLKAPVNSIGNDFNLIFSRDAYHGYMTSNRFSTSLGGNDIYSFELPEPVVKPVDTTKPVKPVEVVPGDTLLVFFRSASSVVDPLFMPELTGIAELMKKNTYLILNVNTSADPRGTEYLNKWLCDERARALTGALTSRGIDASRIRCHSEGVIQNPGTAAFSYNVQIGFLSHNNGLDYYRAMLHNELTVESIARAGGYAYYTGNGSYAEMQKLRSSIRSKYKLDGYVIATYRGYYMEDSKYAPCRRAVLYFSK